MCKARRLQVRSSYAAETLAAARNLGERRLALVTPREMASGALTPTQLKQLRDGVMRARAQGEGTAY